MRWVHGVRFMTGVIGAVLWPVSMVPVLWPYMNRSELNFRVMVDVDCQNNSMFPQTEMSCFHWLQHVTISMTDIWKLYLANMADVWFHSVFLSSLLVYVTKCGPRENKTVIRYLRKYIGLINLIDGSAPVRHNLIYFRR